MFGSLPDVIGFQYPEIRPIHPRSGCATRIVVLVSGPNPTFDYYIKPRLGDRPSLVIDMSDPSALNEPLFPGDYVLACRYLTWRWARRLASTPGLSGIGLMFDDDYVAFLADSTVPLAYRFDVARRIVVPLRMLARKLTDIFVSTPLLQERYINARATILRPAPSEIDLSAEPRREASALRIAFHAQLSHLADHRLAAQIASELAAQQPGLLIDVIGPARAQRWWREIPGVQFRKEVDWPTYRHVSGESRTDILIAPMLDTPLNQARSPTKAIDAVRMGAAAIFPALEPYRELRGAASLVSGGVAEWVAAIRAMLNDPEARHANASATKQLVSGWKDQVRPVLVA